MDYRGDQRPPRSTRPHSQSRSPAPAYPDPAHPSRPPLVQHDGTRGNVSFQNTERGDRQGQLDSNRQHTMPYAYQSNITHNEDLEGADYYNAARVGRQKSLVRPEREKIEPGHRQWHYRNHVAQLEEENHGRLGVIPSTTGNIPQRDTGVRRGRSLLARDQDIHESGLALFKRGATLRRKREQVPSTPTAATAVDFTKQNKRGCYNGAGPGGPWMTYCTILTACFPPFLLNSCGLRSPERQRAWREKIGLISLILLLMAGVGFLTFGFTQVVCGKPPNRFHGGAIGNANIGQSSVVIHGYDYDFSKFFHPKVGMFNGTTNPLYDPGWNLGGNDASFMFQKVNQQCLGIITKAPNSTITGTGQNLDWYFPCNIYSQYGSTGANNTNYETSTSCHIASGTRQLFASTMHPQGQVYYTWDDVYNTNRNLAVFESTVLDLNLLQWLSRAQVNYPVLFDEMKTANGTYNGKDITMQLIRGNQRNIGHCLEDIISIGSVDTNSIGCVASEVVLYLSLVFIIGVVAIRFVMALLFQWFFSWKLGNFPRETYQQRMQRSAEIENWSNDIYRPAPSEYRPNVSKNGLHGKGAKATKGKPFIPKQSRFTQRPTTTYGPIQDLSPNWKRGTMYSTSVKTGAKGNLQDSSKSTMSLGESQCPFPLHNVVPQPPPDYEPFNFPLAHSICLVTAYSESVEGLRTTLDSLATTDYPNSHKLIMVIADGMVKGAGNALTTPEICLQMMKEFIISPDEVEPHSYMAIADGHRRHNMAKVYAGFYDYDDATVERSKQQRVPMVLVAKVGNPLEEGEAKPGNRGKRDSQIMLMGFLQRVMFDERMTTFEYEFFNSIWRVTGVSPDRYELVLCVDADTKVFPDSMTRMVSCMVHDEEIMGLCGETKVANKADSFVTMMQVFEYYISHHMTKAFESMFGGVTCLPGCFSMYRIKARKGDEGYWVPILANPDVVEHYSENVVDTLHKKNLLLLGEDRYLTTLMLKTFPKRKNMFCPQAVCKTVVPDTFRVLLSQRRRWINSTIHNLAELLLVRDLCGTFCFSMQFVVGMELAGTLVLPAAIAFTLYLIIESIIPGGPNTTISLVLLAIVLGLPGLLIVVTSRKIAYIGWMLVYLISLPIWNGVLPAYAFWHFDDFSWGQTRKVLGDKGAHSGDKEGEFDSSRIIMKRWAEFERDRRWRSGTQSRDSTYYEKKSDSNRLSMTSNSDTHHPPSGAFDGSTLETSYNTPRSRHDSNALLMLPAPLAANRPMMASTSTVGGPRSSEDNFVSDSASGSNLRLVPSPQSIDHDSYESHHANQRLLSPQYDFPTSPRMPAPANARQPTSPQYYDGNMYRQLTTSPSAYDENPQVWSPVDYSPEDSRVRGISLTDSGPVPGPEGVRRVSRPTGRRPPSQAPAQNVNRYSRSSAVYSLPPGAAPPSNYYSST